VYHKDLKQWPGYVLGSIRSKRLGHFFDLAKFPAFVETGTCTGNGVEWALESGFSAVHSIELDLILYEQCVSRFKNVNHVHLYHGLSSLCLEEILKDLNGALFIYLDAHFSGVYNGADTSADEPVPLIKETEVLLKYRDIKDCLIVIDDERLMVDPINPPDSWGAKLKTDLLDLWHGGGFTSTYLDDSIIFSTEMGG